MDIKNLRKFTVITLSLLVISCHNSNDYRFSRNNFRLDCNTILQKIDSLTKEEKTSKENKKLKFSYIFIIPAFFDAIINSAASEKRDEELTELQNLRIAKDCKIRAAENTTPTIEIRPNSNKVIDNYPLNEEIPLREFKSKLQQRDYYYNDYRNNSRNLQYYSSKRTSYRSPRYYDKNQYETINRNQKSIGIYNNRNYSENSTPRKISTLKQRKFSPQKENITGKTPTSNNNIPTHNYGNYSKNGTDYIAKKYLHELKNLDKEIFKR
jgi:hypothetical protein